MRRQLARAWVWGVVAAAIGLALYGRAAERAVHQVEVSGVAAAASEKARAAPNEAGALPASEVRTLPVGEAASETDGLLEVRVTAAGRPMSRAQVRLYRREGRVPETGRVQWRVAAAGATGNDGLLVMPARAGAYLVVARAEGWAPAWLNLMHPLGGNRTPVSLRLEEARTFSGWTVVQGTGKPLPEAELTFTPDVSAWEQGARGDAPAEERVTVRSDSQGRFQVTGLAPGLFTVEGRAPGSSLPVEWTLRIPSAEPRVLALPAASAMGSRRASERAPSKELRCGR